ncbi:acyl-CoA dehydrogenase [Pseudonocardiaceae bacterium YIM PH 21723]|nr:acyl-CoA dehydrogenase [Pseudonocardiaceae bacterium YIM PH 21723]
MFCESAESPFAAPDPEANWVELAETLSLRFAERAAEHDRATTLPVDNLRLLHQEGFDTAWLPRDQGGHDLSWRTFGEVLTAIARGCPSTATIWLMHMGAAYGLIAQTDDDFFAGELRAGKRFANALSEPASGNRFLMPGQHAVPTEGGYRLDGAKRFVSGCEIAEYFLVNALVDDKPAFFGITVDASMEFTPIWDSMGLRATRSQLVTFNGTLLPDERRGIGSRGAINPIPVGLAFLSIGVAEAAMRALTAHARGRRIPGEDVQLSEMQWVRFAAAEAHVRLRSARLLAGQLAWLADRGSPQVNQVGFEAKLLANEVAKEVAALGVKIGGGTGFLAQSPIQRHFRDAQAGALMAYSVEVCQSEIGALLMS